MKKMMLVLALFITVGSSTVFAREVNVSQVVMNSFKKDFASAEDVSWSVGANFYKAAFALNGQRVFAFYTFDGELMGLARYISSLQLPIHLLSELKTDYSKYWITDLFEVNNSEGTQYYITLESADSVVKLRSNDSDVWQSLDKKKKI